MITIVRGGPGGQVFQISKTKHFTACLTYEEVKLVNWLFCVVHKAMRGLSLPCLIFGPLSPPSSGAYVYVLVVLVVLVSSGCTGSTGCW